MIKFREIELPSNKRFGLFFSVVFCLLGLYFYYIDKTDYLYIFVLLTSLLLITTIFKSELLLPFNKGWMFIGYILGRIVSPIILGLIFFGIFTPIAIFMKIIRRDELQIKHTDNQSNWKLHNTNNYDINQFKKQY
ncbi:SxtJ family membrane protein [Pelagibacteraceae bacterium]|nr:SxtJ family membrane protein [Pelagibacteraceae bacterium]